MEKINSSVSYEIKNNSISFKIIDKYFSPYEIFEIINKSYSDNFDIKEIEDLKNKMKKEFIDLKNNLKIEEYPFTILIEVKNKKFIFQKVC